MKLKIGVNTLFTIIIASFMITVFVPMFSTLVSCIIMFLGILIGTILYYGNIKSKAFLELLLFVIVMVLYYFFNKGLSFSANGLIYWILCFVSAAIMCLNLKNLEKKQIRFLVILLICLIIYSNISTIVVSIINPMAVRTYGYTAGEEGKAFIASIRELYGLVFMYSYGVGEAMAIISPVLLTYGLETQKSLVSILSIIAVCLSIVSQALCALFTSLLITVLLCIVVLLLYLFRSESSRKFGIFLVLIIISYLGLHFGNVILDNNFLLVKKFSDIFASFRGGTTGETSYRIELILKSFKAWLSNPLFGWADVTYQSLNDGVSMHTAIGDYLGLYGLFSLLLFDSWRRIAKGYFYMLPTTECKYYRWCAVATFLLLAIKGPVSITVSFFFSVVLSNILIVDHACNISKELEYENRHIIDAKSN